jgi:galactokinase
MIRIASSFAEEAISLSLDELVPENLHGWSAYPLGVAWALGQFGADLSGGSRGFEAYIDSDVPIGAGLSSSAAIESATAVALNEIWNLGMDRRTLARVGQLAENRAVGAPTGIMDQSASLLGSAGLRRLSRLPDPGV